MMKTAAASRVELQLIDLTQPLLAQGRFDAIVHKMLQDDGEDKQPKITQSNSD